MRERDMRNKHLNTRNRGVTGSSYGLVVGLIAIVALTATTGIGDSVQTLFTDVGDTLQDVSDTHAGTSGAEAAPSAVPSPSPIFSFTTHTFTTCGATGRFGPLISACQSAYSTSWDADSNNFAMPSQGMQRFTVPATGTYTIEVAGAGNAGGYDGARLSADFDLTQGDHLLIVVGQQGAQSQDGSGGSFVALGSAASSSTALIVGGGAGGHYTTAPNPERRNATFTEDAYYSLDSTTPSNYSGPTGTGGNGGGGYHGGGGGGFSSDGGCNNCDNWSPGESWGRAFVNGAIGGDYSHVSTPYRGGFGGGGAYHSAANGGGGGGGYSGGRGGFSGSYHGWGGGSYTAPSAINRQDLGIDSSGAGFVTITLN
ncbi:MAG: hypothetical protein Alpg2KO_17010 [Alphaproteobacteria bacterium]